MWKWLKLVLLAVGIIALAFLALLMLGPKGEKEGGDRDNRAEFKNDSDRLSNGKCEGDGKPNLTHLPMEEQDFPYILPYGQVIDDHVTPIDHQYFQPKDMSSARDTYPVYAMADSKIVDIGRRDRPNNDYEYRFVFSLSCKLFYYYDLVTGLAPEIESKLNDQNRLSEPIDVKAGQKIGSIGGRTLDFAVWDMDSRLSGYVMPERYIAEPWKLHTVDPLLYFTEELKQKIIPKYLRTAEPISGKIDFDIDGKLIGNWFLKGYGYADSNGENLDAHKAHFSFVPNFLDYASYTFSIGEFKDSPEQFGINNNAPSPADVGIDSGLIKYELLEQYWVDENGKEWDRVNYARGLTAKNRPNILGIALVQMLENRKIKMEIFPDKSAAEVSGFTDNAREYYR